MCVNYGEIVSRYMPELPLESSKQLVLSKYCQKSTSAIIPFTRKRPSLWCIISVDKQAIVGYKYRDPLSNGNLRNSG